MTTPKSRRNQGKPWTPDQVKQLKTLAGQNTPTGVISLKIGKSPKAIYDKASETKISLKPTNKSPYNRRHK